MPGLVGAWLRGRVGAWVGGSCVWRASACACWSVVWLCDVVWLRVCMCVCVRACACAHFFFPKAWRRVLPLGSLELFS